MRRSSTLFVFYLLAFAVAALWSALALPDLLDSFRWTYIWAGAFVRFVDYAIPVTLAGSAVAYSLLQRRKREARRPFYRIVSSQLTSLVVLAILYTVVLFGFYPRSRTLLDQLEELTREGRELLAAAGAAKEAGSPAAELDAYNRYLGVDPKNEKALERRDELQLKLASVQGQAARGGMEAPQARAGGKQTKGKKPHELLAEARGYFAREEWFSAHYYAGLAAGLATTEQAAVKRDAERLMALAWEKIRGRDLGIKDEKEREFFLAKKRGYELLQRGDFLEAYYHFLDLNVQKPGDPDVKEYFARSREEVAKVSFFLEEAARIEPLPGARELLFVNPLEGNTREIVSIGKMVTTLEGTFFKDVEVLRFSQNVVNVHFAAPYGKLSPASTFEQAGSSGYGAVVLLHGISQEGSKPESTPRYLRGSPPKARPEAKYILPLAPRPEELAALRAPGTAAPARLWSVSLGNLWKVRSTLGKYGHLQSALSLEILMRLLLPFAFLNLSLLAVVLGWAYRFGSLQRPPVLAYLVIPVFPVAGALLTGLYLKAHRVLTSFALLSWGFLPALIALAALQGVILAMMLVLLAGQTSD